MRPSDGWTPAFAGVTIPAPVLESKLLMRTLAAILALTVALAPAFNATARDSLHAGCGSASPAQLSDPGADSHAGHVATHDSPVPAQSPCDCGCDCGPSHGCLTASAVAPETADPTGVAPGHSVPDQAFKPLSSRGDTPLYRPPIR